MCIERLSLGTAQLGMSYGTARAAPPTDREAEAILAHAFDLGIRRLDTAPSYGAAEERIGEFLRSHETAARVAVTTKLPSLGDLASDEVATRVEEELLGSLTRLRLERVDIYLIHEYEDLVRHGRVLVDALLRQREAGRIDRAGISAYAPEDLLLAQKYTELEVIQHPYNIFDTRLASAGILADLNALGRYVQLRSVFLQGVLAMDVNELPIEMSAAREAVSSLRSELEQFGLAPVDVALPFALTVDAETVVVGVDTLMQLDEIVSTSRQRLSESVIEVLAHHARPDQYRLIDPRTW